MDNAISGDIITRVKKELEMGMPRAEVEQVLRIAGLEPPEIEAVFTALAADGHFVPASGKTGPTATPASHTPVTPRASTVIVKTPEVPPKKSTPQVVGEATVLTPPDADVQSVPRPDISLKRITPPLTPPTVVTKMPDVPPQAAQMAPVETEVALHTIATVATPPQSAPAPQLVHVPPVVKMPAAQEAPRVQKPIPAQAEPEPENNRVSFVLIAFWVLLIACIAVFSWGIWYLYTEKMGPFADVDTQYLPIHAATPALAPSVVAATSSATSSPFSTPTISKAAIATTSTSSMRH